MRAASHAGCRNAEHPTVSSGRPSKKSGLERRSGVMAAAERPCSTCVCWAARRHWEWTRRCWLPGGTAPDGCTLLSRGPSRRQWQQPAAHLAACRAHEVAHEARPSIQSAGGPQPSSGPFAGPLCIAAEGSGRQSCSLLLHAGMLHAHDAALAAAEPQQTAAHCAAATRQPSQPQPTAGARAVEDASCALDLHRTAAHERLLVQRGAAGRFRRLRCRG